MPYLGSILVKGFLLQPTYIAYVYAIDGLHTNSHIITPGPHTVSIQCIIAAGSGCGQTDIRLIAKPHHTYRVKLPPISGYNLDLTVGKKATIIVEK